MRLPDIGFALAVTGALWLRWEPLRSVDVKTSVYRTRADTVICETPFQIRKALVAMAQDDGARIRSLACTRPGAGKRVRACNYIRALGNSANFGEHPDLPDVGLCQSI